MWKGVELHRNVGSKKGDSNKRKERKGEKRRERENNNAQNSLYLHYGDKLEIVMVLMGVADVVGIG